MDGASSSDPSQRVQWMWNASADPFSKSDRADWRLYSDVENMIIEEAFFAGKTRATLDNYYIDVKHNLQISDKDSNQQRPVKRVVGNRDDQRLRAERFTSNPVASDGPYDSLYGFILPFIQEVVKYMNLTREKLPSKNKKAVPMIVEKAAQGIIEEGKKIGKQREAEKIAKHLMEKRKAGRKEIWKCCAYLYSLESFLYKMLNQTMGSIGSKDHEQVWRSKIGTLGPFCLLLLDNPFNNKIAEPGTIIYRGAELSDDFIAVFKDDCSKVPKPLRSFQAFTSCTRNRNKAENSGNTNVLFIMKLQLAFTVNLTKLSEYPHEEEELLFPGVCFTIDQIEFEKNTNKHLIYITLQQQHDSKSK
jgi:hypothetical protein